MSGRGVVVASAVQASFDLLAPRFRLAVEEGLAACHIAGLDATVYETYRSAELQLQYWARGRTIVPPARPVTNAKSNLYSWHGYGLAVDIVSASKWWDESTAWFAEMGAIMKAHECNWGGDWKQQDTPHVQWYLCRPSPSDRARELIALGGVRAVWEAVYAL